MITLLSQNGKAVGIPDTSWLDRYT